MLKSTVLPKSLSTYSFLELWIDRYKLDGFKLVNTCTGTDLSQALEADGRKKTIAKAHRWLRTSSELASLKTNSLFSYVPNVVSLNEAKRIAVFVEKIYGKLLDVYQQQPISSDWQILIDNLNHPNNVSAIWKQIKTIKLPAIEQIASEVEPLILELQEKHLACQDRRMIGFMSTQFHFSAQTLLDNLQPVEQVLLKPYLQFIEEQVCIPWQRICAASSRHAVNSPVLTAVKSVLPQSEDIADNAYRQVLPHFGSHRSRRGLLSEPNVTASFVRDFSMFQAYLWLCVLEGNMSSVEEELLPLCLMVFPAVSVDWELVEVSIDVMIECIQQHLDTRYAPLVRPYMQAMKQLFVQAKHSPEFIETNPGTLS